MAYCVGDWVPGTCVHFGSLDFIIALDGTLEWIQAPFFCGGLGIVTEVPQDMQLCAWEDDILPGEQPHGFDSAMLERQLHTFLGPHSTLGRHAHR